MSNFFDKSLHHLGRTGREIFVMNIGAMDGVLFDEMIGYTNMYNFKGIYVEPIPYLFEKLKRNIGPDNLFENSAISDYNGTIKMVTIEESVIDKGLVHNCFYGMSAVYPPKNGLGSEGDRDTVDKYGKLVETNCITFETLLSKHEIKKFDIVKIDAEGHDYHIFKQIDLKKFRPSVVRIEFINLESNEKEKIISSFESNGYVYEISGQDIVGITKELHDEIFQKEINKSSLNKVTLVTGLWDIKRDTLSDGWGRSYESYLEKFAKLLEVEENLIIFGDESLEKFVFTKRSVRNTHFIRRDLSWFKNQFFDRIQEIRLNPKWYNLAPWLKDSTQAKLEYYNPLVMSKMFLLHDAKILDKFNSEYLFWIDGGLSGTVHSGYFTHDKVLDKIHKYISKFSFICFPYEANNEIHGFEFSKINEITGKQVNKVARGGFFGGPKDSITEINSIYYDLISSTLQQGYMGTEESIFSIMCYKYPELVNYFEIESNGLLSRFFEDLKNDKLVVKSETKVNLKTNNLDTTKVGLYVITFNSPNQFRTLIESMLSYDEDYINKTTKFLLDNSSDNSTFQEYKLLCEEFGFEHIKKDNLGICGGRQFIAEHFENTDLDYYLFFEDDMFFYDGEDAVCRNGFNRTIKKLYSKSLDIIKKENLDFLKLNYTEFYGDNGTQWSWYNVPQHVREEFWPNNKKLPVSGLDQNAPKTIFKTVLSHKSVPYSTGEIYYCNWPQIVSRTGNKKMFLDTTWAHPFEQTWMSHIYQLTKKGEIESGILLMSPTEHNRFDHYAKELRKES
jgi:FkbM family methyltransferase